MFRWSTNQPVYPYLKSVVAAGNNRVLTWFGEPGHVYRVYAKASLSDANWTELSGNVTAWGNTATWTDTLLLGAPQRFYRIRRVQ